MADAGWYPDAMDEGWQAYFDGQRWTGERRPIAPLQAQQPQAQQPQGQQPHGQPPHQGQQPWQPWNAPAAEQDQYATQRWATPPAQFLPHQTGQQTGQPSGPPSGGWPLAGPQWQDPPPPRNRNRKPLLIAGGVVVVLVAALVTWLAWPDDAPQFTYNGKEISSASKVLAKAESNVQAAVKSRHGASNSDTRCYFAQPKKPAAGKKKSDVEQNLRCGPVLFVDGDEARTYLSVPMTESKSGSTVTLEPSTALGSLQPDAVSSDVTLARPDGKSAPKGSDHLAVPKPPAAAANTLTTTQLGPTTPPHALTGAVMVGRAAKVTVRAAGEIDRYGTGDDARSAPSGQKLIAFQVEYGDGDLSSTQNPNVVLAVSGGSSRALPEAGGSGDWIVAAVPASGTAQVVLDDGGYKQSLDLPSGKPGSGNLAVLLRKHRTQLLFKSFHVPVHVSQGSRSGSASLAAKVTAASLDFWAIRHESVHASSPGKAILTVGLTYTLPKSSTVYGFYPQIVRLRLPNGQAVGARNIASPGHIDDVFEVPADFTSGKIEISGSTKVGKITLRVTKTVTFGVSIAAG